MPDSATYENFLEEVSTVIKERALDARKRRDAAIKKSPKHDFASGEVVAYYGVITLLKQQAEAMNIRLPEFDALNPDRDLV